MKVILAQRIKEEIGPDGYINYITENIGYITDGMFVPLDNNNRHYQEIQQWMKAGNEPTPQYNEKDIINYVREKVNKNIGKVTDFGHINYKIKINGKHCSDIIDIDKVKQLINSHYDSYNRQIIEKHYPLLKLQGFMQISISLQMKLDDPNLTDDEKTAIQNKLAKINSVNDWIQSCTQIYYKYENLFNQATTLEELESLKQQINAEYEEIEEQDPKIMYKDLL